MTRKRKILIRRARRSDRKTVLAFCRRTWGDWGDYIDKVWDEWVADKDGFLAVATEAGRPIGTAKLTLLRRGEVWFEGLRVDPALRGRGIAHFLTRFLLKKAGRHGARVVRYATGERNLASRHIGSVYGFKRLGGFTIMWATSDGRHRRVFSKVPKDTVRKTPAKASAGTADTLNLREIASAVSSASFTRAMHGLASKGWTFFKADDAFIADAAARGQLFVATLPAPGRPRRVPKTPSGRRPDQTGTLLAPGHLIGFAVAAPQYLRHRLLVKLLADVGEGSLPYLFSGARRLAYDLRLPQVRLVAPKKRAILGCATRAGFREEDKGFYHIVLEKTLRVRGARAGRTQGRCRSKGPLKSRLPSARI
ncbi:MAG: GNAT family N-acetyltransferase [Candidatus Eisenbacteria bacterium]